MVKYSKDQLVDWFIGKARNASGYRKNILENQHRARDNTIIGKMYFFSYDPKLKAILPLYDKFPLVIPIERHSDGFLGLNLHYLKQQQRAALLKKLSEHTNNNKMNETTRLELTYNILKSTGNLLNAASPCIKRYLFEHCRSRFIEITADEWDKAIQLPVELFVRKK